MQRVLSSATGGSVDIPTMRLVATRQLEDGARLARDVLTGRPDGMPLLRRGVQVTATYRAALRSEGVHAVWIEDELGANITPHPAITDDTRREATRTLGSALQAARDALARGVTVPDQALLDLQHVASLILADVERCGEAALALLDLGAVDAYTMQHSIDVTALGLVLGRKLFRERGWVNYRGERTFDRIDHRLTLLGLGLLLHDIGKLTVPQSVLDKPGRLDRDEWELVRAHPVAGFEMLAGDSVSPLVRLVVRSHHERFDGSGYPDGLAGEEINELARIAAVADVYDAVTAERAYARARPPHVGFKLIADGAGTAFDPVVVDVFTRIVAPYPPGIEIALADGRRGVVVEVPDDALDKPLVRIGWDQRGRRVRPYELRIDDPAAQIAGSAAESDQMIPGEVTGAPAGAHAPDQPVEAHG